ncbi:MAG: PfkB family carbohydrate kinase [Lentisphaeria bacterium]|nr:PfkB family carbohydrate kinase [Lentisphaeria bacterium]
MNTTTPYDITFVGHMCYDEISTPDMPEPVVSPGSAVLCGAMAAARTGKKIAAVVRMAEADAPIVEPMRDAGVDVFIAAAPETTYSRVIHETHDVDERRLILTRDAGFFTMNDVAGLNSRHVHLAGISDREFSLDFVRKMSQCDWTLSTDMQSFVRQVNPVDREIAFKDVSAKRDICACLSKLKLDIVEARLITGMDDLSAAAAEIASWGVDEILITESKGVLGRINGRELYEPFSNKSVVGRTGRGDTTFASYLSWRLDHSASEALKFAAALVSLKMETPGPFTGSLDDVLKRMKECHAG